MGKRILVSLNVIEFLFALTQRLAIGANSSLYGIVSRRLLFNKIGINPPAVHVFAGLLAGMILPVTLHQIVKKVRCPRAALLGMKA